MYTAQQRTSLHILEPPSLAEIDCVQGCGSKIGVRANFWTSSFCGAKTSAGLFTADILGGGGTEAAGYQPSDVCTLTVQDAQLAYKLELTIVQGCTMVNDWHRMENLKSALCILNASTEGRGIKAHDVCIKTVHTARF